MEHDRLKVPVLHNGILLAGRYRITAPIGRGGMGAVYLAEDLRLSGRRRAVKLTFADGQDREAFLREAEILSSLHHPQLPDIVDYLPPDAEGWAVIVMEYVPGDTLADWFARSGGRLPFPRVYRYLADLCALLCYLHGRQPMVVFRDLKPANVLIDRYDRAVLVDFGIARTYRPEAAADTERLGTPAFAAPEQMRGGQTDARTDLFGWGALAYYLLSGGRFAYRRTSSQLRQELQADVPAAFCDLLERVLAEDPADRPHDAAELSQALRAQAQDAQTLPAAPLNPPFARAWAPSAAAAIPTTDGVIVAAVLSAYPGAGATFAALGLSRHLSVQGIAHALVEFPSGEGELYGLLDGSRRMPPHTVFADPSGVGDTVPAWRAGPAAYYPSDPQRTPVRPDTEFARWLRLLGVPIVLLDMSGKWEQAGMSDWLAESGIQSMWWVADCLPAKWTERRQAAAAELRAKAADRGIKAGWIANRDHPFPERRDWLACFPESPAAFLPLWPGESVIRSVWRGTGHPAGGKYGTVSDRAFQKWAETVIVSQGS